MPRGLLETQTDSERAFLVFVNEDESEDNYVEAELEGLCEAAGVQPVGIARQRLDRPHKGTYLGTGKVEEVSAALRELDADLCILDTEISGMQARNLEEEWKVRVIDRTQLILDIFASRAKTREGQLQVELAQLSYMLPRLMSVYTKFERQKGGIGMRGPGEMKLETDKRLVRDRIAKLQSEIDDMRVHRVQQRASRRKHPFPFACIVGYTSAGKSTLMNKLSQTELLADAMPFATLDPTTRKVELPDGYSLFLTDTVGFIRQLPTNLIAAFRSTLEEVSGSDLILLVIDGSNSHWDMQRDAVVETLQALDAENIPTLTIFNKIDAADPAIDFRQIIAEWPNSVAISALNGTGIDELQRKVVEMVRAYLQPIRALIPYEQNGLIDECYRFGRVHSVDYREEGIYLEAELVSHMRSKLAQYQISE